MFDFGFQELIVIFIVALVVLGPMRMQQLATTVGRWVGKARGMARQFREQLERGQSRRSRKSTVPQRHSRRRHSLA
jgi:Tat protein translocase TatB subunit